MRSLLLASTAAILALCASMSRADGPLSPAEVGRVRPVLPAAIEYFNERTQDPLPPLTGDQIEQLLRGEVVKFRRRPDHGVEDPPERVMGYVLVHQPRDQVWVAALDPEFRAASILTEARLGTDDDGSSLWHQYVSLPWPLTDRHWVIRVGPRRELARATENLVWEQYWTLADGGEAIAHESIAAGNLVGIDPEAASGAIYIPANEGSWILFRVEDSITLVGYRVLARVGGKIPDSWIATFGMAQLSSVLEGVANHAAEIPRLYDPGVHPIVGGDGEPIPRF